MQQKMKTKRDDGRERTRKMRQNRATRHINFVCWIEFDVTVVCRLDIDFYVFCNILSALFVRCTQSIYCLSFLWFASPFLVWPFSFRDCFYLGLWPFFFSFEQNNSFWFIWFFSLQRIQRIGPIMRSGGHRKIFGCCEHDLRSINAVFMPTRYYTSRPCTKFSEFK